MAPAAVVAALLGSAADSATQKPQKLELDGKQVGKWSKDGAGRLNIQIDAAHIADESLQIILRSIVEALSR